MSELLDLAASEEPPPLIMDYNSSVDRHRVFDSGVESRSYRNCTSLEPSNRSVLSSKLHNQSKASVVSRYRKVSRKFASPERDKFRYNMIYNKMHHMLNDAG